MLRSMIAMGGNEMHDNKGNLLSSQANTEVFGFCVVFYFPSKSDMW